MGRWRFDWLCSFLRSLLKTPTRILAKGMLQQATLWSAPPPVAAISWQPYCSRAHHAVVYYNSPVRWVTIVMPIVMCHPERAEDSAEEKWADEEGPSPLPATYTPANQQFVA